MFRLLYNRHTRLALTHIIFRRYFSKLNSNNSDNLKFIKFLKSQKSTPNIDAIHTRNTLSAITICIIGLTFLSIPLYELFCQKSGYLGTPKSHVSYTSLTNSNNSISRNFIVDFVSQSNIHWLFWPCQNSLVIKPGEPTLAFYKAKNLQSNPIIGIATYNVIPDEAGQYFNKIQCFCFEEQMLNPNEEVELPVFFYLDPEILTDPRLKSVNRITLSYTFFESDSDIPEDYKLLQH